MDQSVPLVLEGPLGWIVALALAAVFIAWQIRCVVVRNRKWLAMRQDLQQKNRDLEAAEQQLRHLQDQLIQAEKMTTLGLLAEGIAHALNNPLQTLLTGSRRILRFPEDIGRHRQSARLMEQAALQGSNIVINLLNYARRATPEMELLDLNEVVDSTLSLLQHHLDHQEIDLKITRSDLPPVEGNFNELCTVVTNLVINAHDAVIATAGTKAHRPMIEVSTTSTSAEAVLSVSDSGPGIPDELRARIFDPFFTTKDTSAATGLGLSIARSIVEHHRGRIAVGEATPGNTVFTVYLPGIDTADQ